MVADLEAVVNVKAVKRPRNLLLKSKEESISLIAPMMKKLVFVV